MVIGYNDGGGFLAYGVGIWMSLMVSFGRLVYLLQGGV